jgi:hypothetical protein
MNSIHECIVSNLALFCVVKEIFETKKTAIKRTFLCPRAGSNCDRRLRRPILYPLSYRGGQGKFYHNDLIYFCDPTIYLQCTYNADVTLGKAVSDIF